MTVDLERIRANAEALYRGEQELFRTTGRRRMPTPMLLNPGTVGALCDEAEQGRAAMAVLRELVDAEQYEGIGYGDRESNGPNERRWRAATERANAIMGGTQAAPPVRKIRASDLMSRFGMDVTVARRTLALLATHGMLTAYTSDGTPCGQPLPEGTDLGKLDVEFSPTTAFLALIGGTQADTK